MNNNLINRWSISNALNCFVIVSCPEEGDLSIGNVFAKHVEGSVRTLILGNNPMLYSHSLASGPVGERNDVSCSVDVRRTGLEERITNESSKFISLDISALRDSCGRINSSTNDDHIGFDFGAVSKDD